MYTTAVHVKPVLQVGAGDDGYVAVKEMVIVFGVWVPDFRPSNPLT